MSAIRKLIKNTRGATAIEYGLIAALIAVAMIAAVSKVGGGVGSTFNVASNSMPS
ncbi:MAG TPA: Flp family type IVb pilin [Allosphingosinicella sp.]|jgi:pilus assembly protein Flp/PilA